MTKKDTALVRSTPSVYLDSMPSPNAVHDETLRFYLRHSPKRLSRRERHSAQWSDAKKLAHLILRALQLADRIGFEQVVAEMNARCKGPFETGSNECE